LFVIVATVGRAALTRDTVAALADQTRPPDGVVVIGVEPADVTDVETAPGPVEVILGPRGSCAQRNAGLDRITGRADLVLFLDDDFVPAPDYLEQVERLFATEPDVVGMTGRMIADGVRGPGFSLEEARALVAADRPPPLPATQPAEALYGCNMAFRLSAAGETRFDETLPLYGWQEDIDYSVRVCAQAGTSARLVLLTAARGVHMGIKQGRTSGKRLGYSQVANPFYLVRKGTMPRRMALDLAARNVAANLLHSFRPEPWIDRRGRVRGNLMALADIIRGRADPRRILEFR
jgi:GT2 family glycosyltransferase